MMKKTILNKLLTFLVLASTALSAYAESDSISSPGDVKLVTFNYDAHNTYTILSLPGNITDVRLNEGEKIVALALGDNVQWITAKAEGHIFIKPQKSNIFTSATLVTDQRTYQLTLRSSPTGGKWYQQVSWTYPDLIVMKQTEAEAQRVAQAKAEEAIRVEEIKRKAEVIATNVSKVKGNPVENLNFDYSVSGEAEFKPVQVFDDGKMTWLRIHQKVQEWPAIFLMNEEDETEIVNPIRDGDFIKITRLFKKCVLKLNKKEVVIVNNAYPLAKHKDKSIYGNMPWQQKQIP